MNKILFPFVFVLAILSPFQLIAEESPLSSQYENSIRSSLEQLKGKKVTLRVSNGEEISGTVKEVGKDSVVLSQLSGKEFFDALVKVDQIVAVIARVRNG